MKRKLVLASAVVLILALIAAGTFAYFTKDARATNVITTGTINITLNDEILGGEKTPSGWTLSGVMPGQPVEKRVSVTNTGTADAWLRVKLAVSVAGADGAALSQSFGDPAQPVLLFTAGDGWFQADGYYYYSAPVAPGAETSGLFAAQDGVPTLMLNPQLPNAYQNCTVSIDVAAQAVQVKNNGDMQTLTPENVASIAGTFPQD